MSTKTPASNRRVVNVFDYQYVNTGVFQSDLARMRLAQKAAVLSEYDQFRFAALLSSHGNVLKVANNVIKSNPLVPKGRFSIHSEVNVLRSIANASGTTLYVVRVDAYGQMALGKPCKFCLEYIKEREVKRVCFSVDANTVHSFRVGDL